MTNRRQILACGLAGAVLGAGLTSPGPLVAAAAGGSAAVRSLPLERFVFDTRFSAAAAAAHDAALLGIPLAAVAGNLMPLWYNDLDLRWKRAPMVLGGCTTSGDLFVLETFAIDRGMRVLERREHRQAVFDGDRAERLVSWIIAPRARGREARTT